MLLESEESRMTDINSIALGMQSIKAAIDIAKELRNVDSSLKDAEYKLKIAELIAALSEAKIQLTEANDTISNLKSEIRTLETALKQQQEIEFRDGHYYAADPKVGEAEGPFCNVCYGADKKLILISELPKDMLEFGKYLCPICKDVSK